MDLITLSNTHMLTKLIFFFCYTWQWNFSNTILYLSWCIFETCFIVIIIFLDIWIYRTNYSIILNCFLVLDVHVTTIRCYIGAFLCNCSITKWNHLFKWFLKTYFQLFNRLQKTSYIMYQSNSFLGVGTHLGTRLFF